MTAETQPDVVLSVRDLSKHYRVAGRARHPFQATQWLRAVDEVSFELREGESLGLVGESGCGKSTIVNTLLRLDEPSGGSAYFRGEDIFTMSRGRLRELRREIQVVFQDPYASLNPGMTVENVVAEGLAAHKVMDRRSRKARVRELLEQVGLSARDAERYPHEFSGGQRQRIGIARALSLEPKVIICDEPVSALDVSVQAQVLNLLDGLRSELGLAYLFISHDLGVVRHVADRVAVMYLGEIVEMGDCEEIYRNPRHPYTKALLDASPHVDPAEVGGDRVALSGDLPDPLDVPSGCRFRGRCWKAQSLCESDAPLLGPGEDGSSDVFRCHFPEGRVVRR